MKYDLSVHGKYLPETSLGFDWQLWQDTLELPNYRVFFTNLNLEKLYSLLRERDILFFGYCQIEIKSTVSVGLRSHIKFSLMQLDNATT